MKEGKSYTDYVIKQHQFKNRNSLVHTTAF